MAEREEWIEERLAIILEGCGETINEYIARILARDCAARCFGDDSGQFSLL